MLYRDSGVFVDAEKGDATVSSRRRRFCAIVLGAFLVAAVTLAGAMPAAIADQPRLVVGQGITAAGGLLVDPAGRIWVSDSAKGFCRLAEPSGATPGAIEPATCLGGTVAGSQRGPTLPGAAALLDPTPTSPASGDEVALIPDAASGSSAVVRARWVPGTGTFAYGSTLTLFGGDLRPIGVSIGPDAGAYVVFQRARTIARIDHAESTQPEVASVGFTAATGSTAIAAGTRDTAGRVVLYIASPTALTEYHVPASGVGAPVASYAVGAVARLLYDATARMLYAGTATATAAGGDRIVRVDTASGQVTTNWATGYTRVGGLAMRGSLVVAADDPGLVANPVKTGTGSVYVLGLILPTITAGPTSADGTAAPDPAFTNDPTPTFRISVEGTPQLQCAFDKANWADCAEGDVTAPPLADGAHTFSVRIGAGGAPVERTFTVDTVAPSAPVIVSPASGSTVGFTFTMTATAEADSTLRCAMDAAPGASGTACTSGQAFSLTVAGSHTLDVTAVDRAGNVSTRSTSTFTADLTPPSPVITDPAADGATFTGTAAFAFSAGAETGVTYRCRIDAAAFQACASPASYTGLTAGAHSFSVEASDAYANVAIATRSFQFVIPDTTAPTVSVNPLGGAYAAGQQIALSASEPATIYITTDGSAPTQASPVYTAPLVLSAALTLRYFAVDAAGNSSPAASQAYTVSVAPPPSAHPHDLSGDGFADVVARDAGGSIWLYRGDGVGLWLGQKVVATGAQDVNAIIVAGDYTGDGRADLIVRGSGGDLRLHQGDGAGGLAAPTTIATGWGSLTMPFGVRDWNGDGKSDVIARDGSSRLVLYPGNGAGGLGTAVVIGTGWNLMTAIFSPGDWDGDGKNDVIARDSSGRLWLYPGNGSGGWGASRQIGTGWSAMSVIFGPGDWNGDGRVDVLARDTAGRLWLYPGNGTGGWGATRQVGSGWNSMGAIG